MACAPHISGAIFEDEKRFDLVVRLDSTYRKDIEQVRQLPIATHDGTLIPISEVAHIDYQLGAAQISRDDGRRRIVVGANVRGRDVESTIEEISNLLRQRLVLPAGYYYTFGGQFENLQAAKARLSVAVPVALLPLTRQRY